MTSHVILACIFLLLLSFMLKLCTKFKFVTIFWCILNVFKWFFNFDKYGFQGVWPTVPCPYVQICVYVLMSECVIISNSMNRMAAGGRWEQRVILKKSSERTFPTNDFVLVVIVQGHDVKKTNFVTPETWPADKKQIDDGNTLT